VVEMNKLHYGVMFTLPDKEREGEDFSTKKKALLRIKEVVSKGANKVFLDVYDEDDDLIDYISFKDLSKV
jgi:hypothetical protein